ncbi:uncharacterized protein G2W53_044093 [Senna tora]|uniref:Uncharacterized protein n=1 Tax=Senna tora TaxID=362788 RepID=A0A834W0S1_9FABA|nr:uncharacterized protein G2W53_044093 [Senna tora]
MLKVVQVQCMQARWAWVMLGHGHGHGASLSLIFLILASEEKNVAQEMTWVRLILGCLIVYNNSTSAQPVSRGKTRAGG